MKLRFTVIFPLSNDDFKGRDGFLDRWTNDVVFSTKECTREDRYKCILRLSQRLSNKSDAIFNGDETGLYFGLDRLLQK